MFFITKLIINKNMKRGITVFYWDLKKEMKYPELMKKSLTSSGE